jgi:hypothetical protein
LSLQKNSRWYRFEIQINIIEFASQQKLEMAKQDASASLERVVFALCVPFRLLLLLLSLINNYAFLESSGGRV